jgi:hypothetical protein
VPIFGSRRGTGLLPVDAKLGDLMSNDVQSHEELAGGVAEDDRRAGARHAARTLGSVTARIIGGSQVDLVNFSSRGVLFECDSRLLIGARASVRITTTDANLVVTGRVVRSRVKGLVNGALRYDAALVLDNELALTPAILTSTAPAADADDLVAFETDGDPAFDPSPVEAYLAESEASLLDVAPDELPITLSAAADPGDHDGAAAAGSAAGPADETRVDAIDMHVTDAAEPDAGPAPSATVDDDGDIAFEPAVEFAFAEMADDSREPEAIAAGDLIATPIAAEEPAGASMFDATYIPPAYEAESGESQFEVTPPSRAHDGIATSFFDAHPSETYGADAAAPVEPDATVTAAPIATAALPGADAPDSIDFESEVAFEAADDLPFEPPFDDAPMDASGTVNEPPHAEALDTAAIEDADGDAERPAAASNGEDRVLLQFAATVPHDLAELRRIAADNQW